MKLVISTLGHGIWTHVGVRFTEWLGTWVLLGQGLTLRWDETLFDRTGSYSALSSWGNEGWWSVVLLALFFLRLSALVVNGSFERFRRHSPTTRCLVSVLSCVFWLLWAMGIYASWKTTGGVFPVQSLAFMVLELRNVYISRRDMIIVRGA